jgi:hypothetical protein
MPLGEAYRTGEKHGATEPVFGEESSQDICCSVRCFEICDSLEIGTWQKEREEGEQTPNEVYILALPISEHQTGLSCFQKGIEVPVTACPRLR